MSDTERLAAIAARHQPVPIEMSNRDPKPVWCATCGSGGLPWPCDTRIALNAAARAEGTPGLDAVAFARALRRHEPSIDYHYEEFTCACGWDSDKHRRDSYMAHVQSQVLAVLATLDAARAETPGLREAAEAVVEWADDPTPRTRPAAFRLLLSRIDALRAALAHDTKETL